MLVNVWEDRFGNVHMDPTSAKHRTSIAKDMLDPPRGSDALVFLQEGRDQLEGILSPRNIRHIARGWVATVRMSEDEFRQLCGCDN
jgi:hypothetical protein